jgi:hypothetical protein
VDKGADDFCYMFQKIPTCYKCRNGFIEEAAAEELMILDPARNL